MLQKAQYNKSFLKHPKVHRTAVNRHVRVSLETRCNNTHYLSTNHKFIPKLTSSRFVPISVFLSHQGSCVLHLKPICSSSPSWTINKTNFKNSNVPLAKCYGVFGCAFMMCEPCNENQLTFEVQLVSNTKLSTDYIIILGL